MILVWLINIALICGIGYVFYEEYEKAKWSSEEDAIQKFWTHTVLFVIVVGVIFCGIVLCTNSNKSHGEYHDPKTGREQIQYQGSSEQQQDLKAIDDYKKSHDDF